MTNFPAFAGSVPAPRHRRSVLRRYLPYILIAPSVIMLLVLIAYPLLFALRSSFYFWNLQVGRSRWPSWGSTTTARRSALSISAPGW